MEPIQGGTEEGHWWLYQSQKDRAFPRAHNQACRLGQDHDCDGIQHQESGVGKVHIRHATFSMSESKQNMEEEVPSFRPIYWFHT